MGIQFKKCSRDDCIHGDELQPITNFYKNKNKSDGYDSQCKDCRKLQDRKLKEANKKSHKMLSDDEIRAKTPTKRCSLKSCAHNGEQQPSTNFNICRSTKDGLSNICKDCHRKCREDLNERRKNETKPNIEFLICTYSECSHNGEPQPVENFSKVYSSETGYDIYCKECRKKLGNLRLNMIGMRMLFRFLKKLEETHLILICCRFGVSIQNVMNGLIRQYKWYKKD